MPSILSNKLGKIGKTPIALKEFISLKEEIGKLNHPARPDVNWKKVEELCQSLLRKNGADLQTLACYTIALTKLYELKGLVEGIDYIDTLISKYWFNFWPEQTHVRVEIIAWLVKAIQKFLRAYQFSYSDLTYLYTLEESFEHLSQNFQNLEIKHLTGMAELAQSTSKTAKQLERLEQENSLSSNITYVNTEKSEKNQEITNHDKIIPQEQALPQNNQNDKSTISKDISNKSNIASNVNPLQTTENSSKKPDIASNISPLQTTENTKKKSNIANNISPLQTTDYKKNFWKGFISGAIIIGGIFSGVIFYNKQTAPVINDQFFPNILNSDQINTLNKITGNKFPENTIDNILQNEKTTINQINTQPLWAIFYGDNLIKLYHSLLPQNTQIQELAKQWQEKHQTLANQYVQTNTYQIIQTQLQSLMDKLNGLDERKGKYITVSELKSIVFSIQKPLLQSPPLDELLRQMKEQKEQGKDTFALQQQIDARFLQLLNYYYLLQLRK